MKDNKEHNKKTGVIWSFQVNSTSLAGSCCILSLLMNSYVRVYLWFSKLGVRLTSAGSICMRST